MLVGTLGASLAHAHGPAPAITGVLAGSAQQPTLVALSEGLATLGEERRFVCPARLGLTQPPLSGRAPDGRAWLATPGGAMAWQAPDQLDTRLPNSRVIAFATGPDALYALTFHGSGSELLRVSDLAAGALFSSATPWHTLSHDGAAVWLARVDERQLEIVRLDEHAQPQRRHTLTLSSSPRSIQLRSAAGRAFLHVMLDAGAELLELTDQAPSLRFTSTSPIHGPVEAAGRLFVGHQQTLRTLPDGAEARELLLPEAIQCLERQAGVAYLCLQTRLVRLEQWLAQGSEAPALFRLAELTGPVLTSAGEDSACELQWLTFEADLLRAGIAAEAPTRPDAGVAIDASVDAGGDAPSNDAQVAAPASDARAPTPDLAASGPTREPSGCALSASTRGPGALTALLLAALFMRRRRTRGVPSSTAQRTRTR